MSSRLRTLVLYRRVLCGAGALLCYTAAVVLAPGNAHSQAARRVQEFVPVQTTAEPLPAPVAPANDAFAPRAALDDDAPPVSAKAALPPLPRLLAAPRPGIRPLDPARVTAIATGAQPTAVISSGAQTRVVGVGDTLDGATIERIDETGVELSGGRRLFLDPATGR